MHAVGGIIVIMAVVVVIVVLAFGGWIVVTIAQALGGVFGGPVRRSSPPSPPPLDRFGTPRNGPRSWPPAWAPSPPPPPLGRAPAPFGVGGLGVGRVGMPVAEVICDFGLCRAANPAAARFCRRCGRRLT